MKHDSYQLEQHFGLLCDKAETTQRFYTFDDPRYCVLFRCIQEPTTPVYKGASQTIGTQPRYMLYIYDSQNYNGSVAYKVTKEGILGLNGRPEQVAEQKLLISDIVARVVNQVLGKP